MRFVKFLRSFVLFLVADVMLTFACRGGFADTTTTTLTEAIIFESRKATTERIW